MWIMRRGRDGTFDNRIFRFGVTCALGGHLFEQMPVLDAAQNNRSLKCQDVTCRRMKGCFLLSAADKTASERTYEASAAFGQRRKEKGGIVRTRARPKCQNCHCFQLSHGYLMRGGMETSRTEMFGDSWTGFTAAVE